MDTESGTKANDSRCDGKADGVSDNRLTFITARAAEHHPTVADVAKPSCNRRTASRTGNIGWPRKWHDDQFDYPPGSRVQIVGSST